MAQQASAELLQQAQALSQTNAARQACHQHTLVQIYDANTPAPKSIETFA